ncbi:gametolysin peptidase M11 family protein, partial [Vibrio parahaemolyticus V-223/04]
SFWSHD